MQRALREAFRGVGPDSMAARGDVNPMGFVAPGPKSLAATKELQDGGGQLAHGVDELMEQLHGG
jgi:hypothetical protein